MERVGRVSLFQSLIFARLLGTRCRGSAFLVLACVRRVGCGLSCNFLGAPGHCNFHGIGMYCVGVVVVGDHDVFETTAGCDGESDGLICVNVS